MASTGTVALGATTVLIVVAAAGAGTQVFDVTRQLEETLNATVDSAVRDLAVGWLEVTDAQGRVVNGTITEADLVVRMDGTVQAVDLDRLVVERESAGTVELRIEDALRDRDGSVANGTINEDDLVRLKIPLEPGLDARGAATLNLHDPDSAPLELTLTAPRAFTGTYEELEVSMSWS